MVYVKLTLSSNGLPTYINAETINQLFEDTDSNGKPSTRIEFSNDFTRVSEPMKVVILKIAKAKLNSQFGYGRVTDCIGCYTDTNSVKSEEE